MIISRTPYRISFLGGGSDYPCWYLKHGGAVLASTIDKYCYISCRYLPPFFEHKHRVVYSKIESVHDFDEISHPSVREILKYLNIKRGIEIHHDGDLPARSGMGTSSSFSVGLMHALYALIGKMPSKEILSKQSIYIEQEVLKETVGSQDQMSAAYGGLNHIVFMPNGEISIRPVTISRERINELNSHCMLFYTNIKRTSSNISKTYTTNINENKRQIRIMKDLVEEGISILSGNDTISAFGELLNEAWLTKRSLSNNVSNQFIDDIYEKAISKGAVGGKITGAGGGGFMLLFVPPEKQKQVRDALNNMILVPFKFEFGGSQIIFYSMENDYSNEERYWDHQQKPVFKEMNSLLCEGSGIT